MKLNVFTVNDIRKLRPCYDPVSGMDQDGNVIYVGGFVPEDWTGTALDALKINACPAEDRLWLVLRNDWIDNRTLRLFAVWCARQALQLVDDADPRSIAACDTAERFAHGTATAKELAAACDAARNAAWDSTWAARAAADAAAKTAVKAAWSAARSAAEAAVEAAARTVRVAAWNTARPAPWTPGWTGAQAARAAAREEQVKHLIEMLDAED